MTEPTPQLTSGSLFAGYGGLHRGVEAVFGARLAWVSDIPQYDAKGVLVGDAPAILAHRYPGVPNLGDITTIDWDTVPRMDIIDGGSPCQDVSAAGKRAGMVDGTRSNLWVAMRDAIATIQPAFVIWENVRGALSAPAASAMESDPGLLGDHRGVALRAAGRVLGDLADLGFDAEWEGLRAADVGAPHGRWRVFVLAAHPERVARLERRLTAAGQTPPWRALSTTPRRDRAPITLLPTPRAADGFATMGAPGAARHVAAGNGSLAEVIGVDLLPTPTATPYGSNRSASDGATVRPSLAAVDTLFPTPRTVRCGSGTETIALLPTPTTAPMTGNGHARNLGGETRLARFGKYAPAIARWEQIVGPAPAPTKPGRTGKPRLNPEFASWLMGLPPGWITDTPGLTDNQALHAAGNGCVPQQVAAALEICLRRLYPPSERNPS